MTIQLLQVVLHCLQALSWGNTLAQYGGPAYIAADATSPLPSMHTPTPVDIEAALMDLPSSTPACAPGPTLPAQPKNQVNTAVALSSGNTKHTPSAAIYLHCCLKPSGHAGQGAVTNQYVSVVAS